MQAPDDMARPSAIAARYGRILLLGGTGDALRIARHLRHDDVYSLAGLGTAPTDLACRVREGGFGGVDGLTQALQAGDFGVLVDATHPYAARISANAVDAAGRCGLSYWRLERPAWTAHPEDRWTHVDDWPQTLAAVGAFRRPLWTLGREPLAHLNSAAAGQHWFVRCLPQTAARHDARDDPTVLLSALRARGAALTLIPARGPFSLDAERRLLASLAIDVIVSKNSGGAATDAKLQAAREMGLSVIMRRRPHAAWAGTSARLFSSAAAVLDALAAAPTDVQPTDHSS